MFISIVSKFPVKIKNKGVFAFNPLLEWN